jgi:hypothetical protein
MLQPYFDDIIDTIRHYEQDVRLLGFKYETIKGCYFIDSTQIVIFSIDNGQKNNGSFSKFMDEIINFNIDVTFKYVTNQRLRKHLIEKYHFYSDGNDVKRLKDVKK